MNPATYLIAELFTLRQETVEQHVSNSLSQPSLADRTQAADLAWEPWRMRNGKGCSGK